MASKLSNATKKDIDLIVELIGGAEGQQKN